MDAPRVLMIDDNPDYLKMMGMGLRSLGYDVITTDDPGKGIRLAEERRPDVVLLDLYMPGLDGFEVSKILAVDERTRDIPVIILTVADEDRFRKKSIDWGADEYIQKKTIDAAAYVSRSEAGGVIPLVDKDKVDLALLKRTIDKVLQQGAH